MKNRGAVVALCALAWSLAARADDVIGTALVAKFGACFEAEGGALSDDDRALLSASSADLAKAADVSVGGVSCAAEPAAGITPPSAEACTAAVQALSCDGFGADLGDEATSLSALPPPPAWAVTYVQALTSRTLDCYAAEVGAPVAPEQKAQVDGFSAQLASGLGVASSGGTCKVHDDRLASCTSWLAARTCDALLGDLNTLLGQGGDAAGAGTAATPPPTTTSADGIDVDTASDAELDTRLAAAESDRQGLASQLIGPCAALVDCSTDLDATLDANAPPDTEP